MQMLWINLIMDTFAALALATEPPSWAVMEGPPRKPDDFIVSPAMARNMFITGLAFAAALLGLLLYFQRDGHVDDHEESIFFTIFVMLQFWNLFNARCLGTARSAFTNLFENKAFVSIAAAILIGQVFIVTFGGETFRVTPLNPLEWLAILGGTGLVLVVGEAMRAQARAAAKAPA
jgi:Ca2+-transporting ATPase